MQEKTNLVEFNDHVLVSRLPEDCFYCSESVRGLIASPRVQDTALCNNISELLTTVNRVTLMCFFCEVVPNFANIFPYKCIIQT